MPLGIRWWLSLRIIEGKGQVHRCSRSDEKAHEDAALAIAERKLPVSHPVFPDGHESASHKANPGGWYDRNNPIWKN
jgi:hypothetical protein